MTPPSESSVDTTSLARPIDLAPGLSLPSGGRTFLPGEMRQQLAQSADESRVLDLIVLLSLAFTLRLGLAFLMPSIAKEDEIFQVVEPAYHWLYGGHNLAWEWAVGLRSWLFPGLVAGLLKLGEFVDLAPPFQQIPVTVFMAAASLAPVACAYHWGGTFHGRRGALLAGAVASLWNDLVYMAPHPLSGAMACYLMVPAMALAYPRIPRHSGRAVAAGLLFGFSLALRIQLAPAILLALLVIVWRGEGRTRWLLLAAAVLPMLLSGMLDWITYGAPFHSLIANVEINLFDHVSADFGTEPWYRLFLMLPTNWGWPPALVVALLAAIGARRLPLLAAVALTILASHTLVPHKEYRFIFPGVTLLVILGGIGTAEICVLMQRWTRRNIPPMAMLVGGALLWGSLSLSAATTPASAFAWTKAAGDIAVMRDAAAGPKLCGIGLLDTAFWELPGAAASPAGVPIFQTAKTTLRHDSPGFDAVIADGRDRVDMGYSRVACFPDAGYALGKPRSICLWRRASGCITGPAKSPAVNWPPQLKPPM